MRILVACEFSGIVRDAFIARGHDAWSCDLLETERPGPHYQCDVLTILDRGWDMMCAFPDCTFLCSSGIHWNNRGRGWEGTYAALKFVQTLMDAPIEKIQLENPVGVINTRIRKPDQIIQPYNFGEDASKQTCLWLKNLPKLEPTRYVSPRLVKLPNGKVMKRWANQTDSGQNKLGPKEDRWKDRARTYPGIAYAMAAQWSELLLPQSELRLVRDIA